MASHFSPDDLTIVEDMLSEAVSQFSRDALRRRMKRVSRRARRRKQRAWRSGWLLHESMCDNPLLVRLTEELEIQAGEARQCAVDHAGRIVGRIAGEKPMLSSTSILFLVTEARTIKAAVLNNASRSKDWEISVDDAGIVPYVAREGVPYLAEDTEQEEMFVAKNANVRCELAVPVKFDNEVIGVLNLESDTPGVFTRDTLAYVQSKVADLVPHLLVLRAIEAKAKWRCPWHPLVHGWDLRRMFQRLCEAFADELGREAAKCTIWYVDQPKQELFAYATYGYDWKFCDKNTISISRGPLARFVKERSSSVVVYSPGEEEWFMDEKDARSLRIETGLIARTNTDDECQEGAVCLVNVYLNEVECPEMYGDREMIVRNALVEVCRVLRQLIVAYVRQRVGMAISVLTIETSVRHHCTLKALLERWIFKVCELFQAPAGSLYGTASDGDLVCLASTGFRRAVAGLPYGIDERDDQIEDKCIRLDEPPGHTAVAFRQGGRAVRRNRMGFSGEKGIPESCPECGGRTTPEFICGEQFEAGEHSKRRFLGCAVMEGDEPIGVLRIVRPQVSLPFTRCNEKMIECICRRFSDLITERIEERNAAQDCDHVRG